METDIKLHQDYLNESVQSEDRPKSLNRKMKVATNGTPEVFFFQSIRTGETLELHSQCLGIEQLSNLGIGLLRYIRKGESKPKRPVGVG